MFTDISINIISSLVEKIATSSLQKGASQLPIAKFLKRHKILQLKDSFESIYLHSLIAYHQRPKQNGWLRLFALEAVIKAYHTYVYDETKNKEQLVSEVRELLNLHAAHGSDELLALYQSKPTLKKIQAELEKLEAAFEATKMQTLNPMMLDMFNKMKQMEIKQMELQAQNLQQQEALRKTKFPYQAERYLRKFITDFYEKYLDPKKGLPKYIPVHGETRIYQASQKQLFLKNVPPTMDKVLANPDKAESEKEKYEATPFKPINTYLNQWLQDDNQNLLIVVGEYGTGKTTLMRYLTYHLGLQYLSEAVEDAPLHDPQGRLPVFMPLNKFEQQLSSFVEVVCKDEGISDIDFSRFKERAKAGELLIILDGFDEMTQYINSAEQRKNFGQIQRQLLNELPNSKGHTHDPYRIF